MKNPEIHLYNYRQFGAAIELAGGSAFRILADYEDFLILLANNNIKVHCEYVLPQDARVEIEKSLPPVKQKSVIQEEVVPHDPNFELLKKAESLKEKIKSTLNPNGPTGPTS